MLAELSPYFQQQAKAKHVRASIAKDEVKALQHALRGKHGVGR